eukprot:Em0002g687a
MLVDTGSAVTLVRENVLRNVKLGNSRKLEVLPNSVVAANGEKLDISGQCTMSIKVTGASSSGSKEFKPGMPSWGEFFDKAGSPSTARFADTGRPSAICVSPERSTQCSPVCFVTSSETLNVPPYCQMCLPAGRCTSNSSALLVEPVWRFTDQHGLMVAHSIIDVAATHTTVQVLNSGFARITVYKEVYHCARYGCQRRWLGAVLTQNVDGVERVVAYASRALSRTEKKYCAMRCMQCGLEEKEEGTEEANSCDAVSHLMLPTWMEEEIKSFQSADPNIHQMVYWLESDTTPRGCPKDASWRLASLKSPSHKARAPMEISQTLAATHAEGCYGHRWPAPRNPQRFPARRPREKLKAKVLKEVFQLLGVKKTRTTLYHPQSDGLHVHVVERPWQGPFKVVKVLGPSIYRIVDCANARRYRQATILEVPRQHQLEHPVPEIEQPAVVRRVPPPAVEGAPALRRSTRISRPPVRYGDPVVLWILLKSLNENWSGGPLLEEREQCSGITCIK